jgi:hypothetical protein
MIFDCCFGISEFRTTKKAKKKFLRFGSFGTQLQKTIIFSTIFLKLKIIFLPIKPKNTQVFLFNLIKNIIFYQIKKNWYSRWSVTGESSCWTMHVFLTISLHFRIITRSKIMRILKKIIFLGRMIKYIY